MKKKQNHNAEDQNSNMSFKVKSTNSAQSRDVVGIDVSEYSKTAGGDHLAHLFEGTRGGKKGVNRFFYWNIFANLAVLGSGIVALSLSGGMVGWGQVITPFLNMTRSGAYVLFSKKLEKNPDLMSDIFHSERLQNFLNNNALGKKLGGHIQGKEDIERLVETGFFAAACISNSFQVFDATNYVSQAAGFLASSNYAIMTMAPWRKAAMKRKKTYKAAYKVFEGQCEIERLMKEQETIADQDSPEYQKLERDIESTKKYLRKINSASGKQEKKVTRWYRAENLGGVLMLLRGVSQMVSGIFNFHPDALSEGMKDILGVEQYDSLWIGAGEMLGGGIFVYGAGRFSKDRNDQSKNRKQRVQHRQDLQHSKNPQQWLEEPPETQANFSAAQNPLHWRHYLPGFLRHLGASSQPRRPTPSLQPQ